jgi:hypothetical protein
MGVTGSFGSSCSKCNATQKCRVNSDCKSAMCFPTRESSIEHGLYKLKNSHFEMFRKFDSQSFYPSKTSSSSARYSKDIFIAVHSYGTDYIARFDSVKEIQDEYCNKYSGTTNNVDPMSPLGSTILEKINSHHGTGSYCKTWLSPSVCQGSDIICDWAEIEPINLQCRSCTDRQLNGDETCIDGGGLHCREIASRCGDGQKCKLSSDCLSGHCYHKENSDEIKIDCAEPAIIQGWDDPGYPDNYRGWYDVQGCGQCNDYCRWVGNAGSGGDPNIKLMKGDSFWSCRKAGTNTIYSTFNPTDKNYYGKPWNNNLVKCGGKSAVNPRSVSAAVATKIEGGEYNYNINGIPLLPPSQIGFGVCVSCGNSILDGTETGIDCGGITCPKCENNKRCNANSDCLSTKCDIEKHICRDFTRDELCSNSIINAKTRESSIDCGGECSPCVDGKTCNHNGDCRSNSCFNNVCVSCFNMIKDGKETDKDCKLKKMHFVPRYTNIIFSHYYLI